MMLAINQYKTLGGIRKETVWGLLCALALVARPPRGIRYQNAHAPLLFRHMVIKLPWLPWWQEEPSSTAGCVSRGAVLDEKGGGRCDCVGRLHISPKRPYVTRRNCHQQWKSVLCGRSTKAGRSKCCSVAARLDMSSDDRWRSRTATDLIIIIK